MENGKEIEVIREASVSEASKALMTMTPEDLDRIPTLSITRIKPKNGKLVLHDDLYAPYLDLILLDHSYVNMYFEGAYVEGASAKPACYANSIYKADMAPPSSVPKRQSDYCVTCWANAYRSAKTGEGKACKNSIKVVGALVAEQGGTWAATLVELQLPPKTIGPFEVYRSLVEGRKPPRPLRSVFTRVSLDMASSYPLYVFDRGGDVASRPGLSELILSYPLGPGTSVRQHLLRGFTYTAEELGDAPVSTKAVEKAVEDDEIPF